MASTLNDTIGKVIRGTHVLGEDGLHDYHTIQAVKHAMRRKSFVDKLQGVKAALRNYRVIVSISSPIAGPYSEHIRVFCPETKAEVIL